MVETKLERCINGCCYWVNSKEVTRLEYDYWLTHYPGSYPAIQPEGRNAILYGVIGCKRKSNVA